MNSNPSSAASTRVGARPFRVALCYSGCHSRGGVERVMLEAARHLRATCEVSVLAQEVPSPGELGAGVHIKRLGGIQYPMGFGLSATRRRSEWYLSRRKHDVVGAFGVQAPEDSVVWFQSVHGAWLEHCRARRHGMSRWLQALNPFHPIVQKLEGGLLRGRRYRRLIALTETVKADLKRLYDVPGKDIDVIPNGFRREEFNLDLRNSHREELRHSLNIPADAWVVLFVANEWERKGLIPLLDALAQMRDPDVHLVAVGRLPVALINALSSARGLTGRVHLVGATNRVSQWFGIADAFVLPTFYEAWGMVIIEAMASGLPVLTSRNAGAAEAVKVGFNGWLLDDPADPNEVMRGCLRLRAGLEWRAEAIAASVDAYQWGRIFERYEAVLRSVAQ